MSISIIVPTLNEEKTIKNCLEQFLPKLEDLEIIVVDGGSSDSTKEIVKDYPQIKFIEWKCGRATQMNRGAKEAKGEILLFLHSDTFLPHKGWESIWNCIDKGAIWGWFNIRFDDQKLYFQLMEKQINFFTQLSRLPTGDQAIFIRHKTFNDVGGYKDMPLMEDLDLARRLRKISKGKIIRQPVITSARRWQKGDFLKTALLMFRLNLFYFLGVPSERLATVYSIVR